MTNQDIALLELICREVEEQHLDIAHNYNDWVVLTYGLATDFGETGRSYFHRICSQYTDGYDQASCDKIYTYALAHTRGQAHFGSICHLAKAAGVDTEALRTHLNKQLKQAQKSDPQSAEEDPKSPNPHDSPALSTRVHAREDQIDKLSAPYTKRMQDVEESRVMGSEPFAPLPHLWKDDFKWPLLLNMVLGSTDNPTYRDVLLLGSLTAMGATLGKTAYTEYSGRMQYANMQTFIVAPSASGKGILSFVKYIVDPIHHELRQANDAERKKYKKEKDAWDRLGSKRSEVEEPEAPPLRMLFLPGNITGTGILQLLIDNGGKGFIFEVEADTVSSAIKGEYGQWSDALRKCFENEGLNYFRRTGQEYKEVNSTFLSVLLSGTPGQVKPLIPSAENGLFSRQIFYYMPGADEFLSQFTSNDRELTSYYKRIGAYYQRWYHLVTQVGHYWFKLNKDQQKAFDNTFSDLFQRSKRVNNAEMNSSVIRLAINILRIMLIVALLRATEQSFEYICAQGEAPKRLLYNPVLMEPSSINQEQRSETLLKQYSLFIEQSDFEKVLAMAEPLFKHALHVLSLLDTTTITRRTISDQDDFLGALNPEFTMAEAKQLGCERNLTEKQVEHWIYNWRDKGLVTPIEGRGKYRKNI